MPVALLRLHASPVVLEVQLSPAAIAAWQHILSAFSSQCREDETVIGRQCALTQALYISQCC
jgi:hypothetical protein